MNEFEKLSAEINAMREEIRNLEAESRNLERSIKEKQNEINDLENERESELLSDELKSMQNQAQTLENDIKSIEDMVDNKENVIASLENRKTNNREGMKTMEENNVNGVLEAIDNSENYFEKRIADKKQRIVVSEDMVQGVDAQQASSGLSEDKSSILRKLINSGKFIVDGKLDVKELALIVGITEDQVLLEQDFINAKNDLNKYEKELEDLEQQQKKFNEAKEEFKREIQKQRRMYDRRVEMRQIRENMARNGNTSQDLIDSLNKDIGLDHAEVINKVKKSLVTLVNAFPEHVRKDAIKYTQMILEQKAGDKFVESLLGSRIADKNDVSNMNLDTLNQKREELLNEKESIKAEINERLNNDDVDPVLNDKFKDVVSKLKEVDEFIKKQQKGSFNPEPQLSSNEVVSKLSNALSEKEVEVILNLNSNGKKEVLEGMAEDRGVTLDELVRAAGKKKASIDLGKGAPEHTHENDNNKKYKHYASIVDKFNNNADIPAVSFVDKVRAKEKEEVKRLKDKRRSFLKGMFTLDSAKRRKVKSIRNRLKERINKERELANSISSEMISVDYAQNNGVNQEPVVENNDSVDNVSINDFSEFNDISEEDLKNEFGNSVKNR